MTHKAARSTGVETEKDPFNSVTFDRIKIMAGAEGFAFAVELKSSNGDAQPEMIGAVGMFRPGACGYQFDEPYWGMGYATEALTAWLQKYWEYFPEGPESIAPENRNHLLAHVFEGNVASEKVLLKSGFRVLRAKVPGTQAGHPVIETVFIVERPEPVPIPADAAGLPT
ncbi:hypothetical protein TruAng_000142 [Truncatella angustata]|nr:hypothetical protein TruAng_000142 [Truncatella angustata]